MDGRRSCAFRHCASGTAVAKIEQPAGRQRPIAAIRHSHPWDVSIAEAQAIQLRLAAQVSRESGIPDQARYVAGADLSPPDGEGLVQCGIVVLEYPALAVVEVKTARGLPGFPYVPGLLSFRESPLVLAALERLEHTPDLLLCDGQGLAHPRRFGLACHLGVLTGLATIGCAKSRLTGRHEAVALERGGWSPLVDRGEVVGAALRTREGVQPLYVSIGHRVDLPSAVRWTLACCRRYRVPEPTRLAHFAAAGKL
ncbi:MAG: deoxyribonuclease V [Chloroflexi bacterium]|nr:deoxyribonuclease V [Chloroflexota bacterium]